MNLSWIAGFYESEGCPGIDNGYLKIQIVQADRRILNLIQKYLGLGKVYPRRQRVKRYKKQWMITFWNRDAHRFAKAVLPFMQMPRKKTMLIRRMKKHPAKYYNLRTVDKN